VINLETRTVRTVTLPNDDTDGYSWHHVKQRYHGEFFGQSVILGGKHAYFLTSGYHGCLYSINRQTLEAKRVKLPLPKVIGLSPCARGDELYVSIAQEWDKAEDQAGPNGATAVVAIEGAEIKETLVSNMRKPPQTPLDDPITRIKMIHVGNNKLFLLSPPGAAYIGSSSYGAARGWEGGEWQKLSNKELREACKRHDESCAKRFFGHRQVSIGKNKAYFTEDWEKCGVPAAIVIVNDQISQLNFTADWLKRPSMAGKIRLIPVSAAPLAGNVQMDRQMHFAKYALDRPGGRGAESVYLSANAIIQSALYDVSVFCKWREEFLVFLTYNHVGTCAMPAIWTASGKEIQRLAQTPENR
jgi:hypothetical protein